MNTVYLNRHFHTVARASCTKLLFYEVKRSASVHNGVEYAEGEPFSPLEVLRIMRRWEQVLQERLTDRYMFACDSSLFVGKDRKDIAIFVKARDESESQLQFLFNYLVENERPQTEVKIYDMSDDQGFFISTRKDFSGTAADQEHLFLEKVRFYSL